MATFVFYNYRIVPVNCPLWIIAVATAFAVIFAKEVFGGTGMNILNVALHRIHRGNREWYLAPNDSLLP